jgi:hypothetical protein
MDWAEKKSSAIRSEGLARVKPNQKPLRGSGRQLRGTLRVVVRVTPSHDQEMNQEVELHASTRKARPG